MTPPSAPRSHYTALISSAISLEDPATLALVERLMRDQTGGVLDHLDASTFDHLARQAYEDGRAWDTIGEINGCTLADYCRANDLTQPHWSS
jgi:hypothetical protein